MQRPSQLPCLLALCLLLVLTLAKPATAAGDPKCNRGIERGGACCPKKCGKCGGKSCFQRGRRLKTTCCIDGILKRSNKFPSCKKRGPPCVLRRGGSPPKPKPPMPKPPMPKSPQPKPDAKTSTLAGRWRTGNVKSGSLKARHEACAVMVNGLVVLLAGRGVNKEVSIYNPGTKTWRAGSGPGSGIEIHHVQCVGVNGQVWIVSSWTGSFPFEKNNRNVFVYDVRLNKWSRKAGLPANRNRGGGAAVRVGDIIYLIGGNRGGHGGHATALGWMDAYNWRSGRWLDRKYPDMPGGGRDHVGGAVVKGQICVAGGRDSGRSDFFDAVKKETYCYNLKTGIWSRKNDFPSPRAGAMTAATCDGRMMIAGGEGNGRAYSRVDVFDGTVWKNAPNMVRARHGSGIAVSNCACGHLFIPSGSGNQGGGPELPTTEQYVPFKAKMECGSY